MLIPLEISNGEETFTLRGKDATRHTAIIEQVKNFLYYKHQILNHYLSAPNIRGNMYIWSL